MQRGYTKRWRKRWDAGYHKDPLLWVMIDYFIDFATHKDMKIYYKKTNITINLKRGQLIYSERKLAKFFNSTRKKIRSRLELLEKADFLHLQRDHQRDHLLSVATIQNYDKYNPVDNDAGTTKGTIEGSPKTDFWDHQRDHLLSAATIQDYNKDSVVDHDAGTTKGTTKEKKRDQEQELKEYKYIVEDSIEFRLADFLFRWMQKNKPDIKKPNMQTWAKHIDLMIRLDGRKPERIKKVIEWCQKDSFWQSNILSTKKLREKFDQLEIKMGSSDHVSSAPAYTPLNERDVYADPE